MAVGIHGWNTFSGWIALKFFRDQTFTPSTYHEHWARNGDIPRGDRSVYEHECFARILEAFITIDQVNAPALQGMELLCCCKGSSSIPEPLVWNLCASCMPVNSKKPVTKHVLEKTEELLHAAAGADRWLTL